LKGIFQTYMAESPFFFERVEFKKTERHNKDDLNTSERLFKFLKMRNPELLPFE